MHQHLARVSDLTCITLVVQVNIARRQLGMRVFGFDAPKPIQTFAQCEFDAVTMAAIKKAGYMTFPDYCCVT